MYNCIARASQRERHTISATNDACARVGSPVNPILAIYSTNQPNPWRKRERAHVICVAAHVDIGEITNIGYRGRYISIRIALGPNAVALRFNKHSALRPDRHSFYWIALRVRPAADAPLASASGIPAAAADSAVAAASGVGAAASGAGGACGAAFTGAFAVKELDADVAVAGGEGEGGQDAGSEFHRSSVAIKQVSERLRSEG